MALFPQIPILTNTVFHRTIKKKFIRAKYFSSSSKLQYNLLEGEAICVENTVDECEMPTVQC
jgi:hypothetical protein